MRERVLWVLVGVLLGAISSPAATAAPLDIDCRAIGATAEQEETICIATPWGPQLARCGMVLNVSSWTFLGTACEPGAPQQPWNEDEIEQPAPERG